jgi:hypothetical protein
MELSNLGAEKVIILLSSRHIILGELPELNNSLIFNSLSLLRALTIFFAGSSILASQERLYK